MVHLNVYPDYKSLSEAAAEFVVALLQEKHAAHLILPTGDTPLGLFERLVDLHQNHGLDFSQVQIMALDEWLGLSQANPLSCYRILRTSLIDRVNIHPAHFYGLDGMTANTNEECVRYRQLHARLAPIDLAVLGLGRNGHIGLNEPATCLPPWTHLAELASVTMERLRDQWELPPVPDHGLTLGLAEIMQARRVLLLANGVQKAQAVREALTGPLSTSFPAGLLRLHRDMHVLIDVDAAASIDLDRLAEEAQIES